MTESETELWDARRELIDTLYRAQAVKLGLRPDIGRGWIGFVLGMREFLEGIEAVADLITSTFAPLLSPSTLPARHGAHSHTSRTRYREYARL